MTSIRKLVRFRIVMSGFSQSSVSSQNSQPKGNGF
ncbi:hypothetical protein F383_24769 [Gossypium arboreum]|uniref:Uncharacterized protein n=1 Tax=Gossypium arboreum TaxID=29729 RepID=A0A0B0P5I3_GOSAR|nr:hypothetical protein F383_24769 [Gossypium arboreum]